MLGADAYAPVLAPPGRAMSALVQACLLLAGVAVVGALLPLARTWSDRGLHMLLSVAAGVFLGALFLELLPELSSSSAHDGTASRLPWAAALAGLLLLFFLERIWLREKASAAGPHQVVWIATFTGLTTHAFVFGLGLATLDDSLILTFALALSIHKAVESFSLATVMRLAELPLGRAWGWLLIFALATPLGLVVGRQLTTSGDAGTNLMGLLRGLAAGTFLYVAAYNLLPEVFHGRQQRRRRVVGLLVGLAGYAATMVDAAH